MRLSVITAVKNEEAHLPQLLKSLAGLADEVIVVVDSSSTDRTAAIAREFNARVFIQPWKGYGPQKNFALSRATGDWALFLDADEELTPALAGEIRRQLSAFNSQRLAIFLRIVTEFLGRPLTHLWGTNPRLLRRGTARWDNRRVHEQVVRADGSTVRLGDPDTALLHNPLRHVSHYQTLAAYRERRERYTTREAREMLRTGHDRLGRPVPKAFNTRRSALTFLYGRALKQFFRLTVKKRGFLDGWQGCLWCWLSAEYEVLAARKYLTLVRENSRGFPEEEAARELVKKDEKVFEKR